MDKVETQVREKEHRGKSKGDHGHEDHSHHEHGHKVTVKVDGHPEHVEPGTYVVSAFKDLVGVAAAANWTSS